jgi:hypothetical protein
MLIGAFFGVISIREAAAIKEKIDSHVDHDPDLADTQLLAAEENQPAKTAKRKSVRTRPKLDSQDGHSI